MSKLLSSLPVGTKIRCTDISWGGFNSVELMVLQHGNSGDPSGSTALWFCQGLAIMPFDGAESLNPDTQRSTGGNNRYLYSNLLQWLNSDKLSGWYSAQHAYDAPPNSGNVTDHPYDEEPGFLSHFSDRMKSSLMTVSKKTMIPKADRGSTVTYENVSSKVFLLSATEVGETNDPIEGYKYSYFNNTTAEVKRRRTKEMIISGRRQTVGWWLRSACGLYDNEYGAQIRDVSTGGTVGHTDFQGSWAYDGSTMCAGVFPAICVSSNMRVTDSPVAGYYEFVWNSDPTISPASTNYGSIATPPSITCTLADADGDSFTYTVKLNGVTKDSGSGTASKTFALDMTSYWSQMSLGTNTIVVQVTDSQGATASATYTMNKTNSAAPVPTTDLVNNARKDTSFYIGFQIGQDSDGDSQTVVAQVSASSDMSNPTEFSSIEKEVAGAWLPVQTLTNSDAGASLRVQVTGQTVGDTIYVRLKDTDSGSGSPVYTSTYAISIGNTLEFDTLPLTRTEKPSLVVANLDKTMPVDATLTMYACNNANDAVPTWEPITEGVTHQFTNKTKTAANWGVSVKTNIAAGSTAGEISVTAIGMGVL